MAEASKDQPEAPRGEPASPSGHTGADQAGADHDDADPGGADQAGADHTDADHGDAEPSGASGPGQGSFIDRIGAALVAPRRALAATDTSETSGTAGNDLMLLIALTFAAVHTREFVVGVWLGATEGVGVGLMAIFGALSRSISTDLAFLLISAVLLTVSAGKKRKVGRDFDLASVALIPMLVVEIVATLIMRGADLPVSASVKTAVTWLAYGWSSLVLILAWLQARSRTGADTSRCAQSADPGRFAARRRARFAGLGVLTAAALILGINSAWIGRNIDALRPISPGNVAPPFSMPAVDESGRLGPGRITLDALRGKVIVLDFWATWCGPCRKSLPAIERVYRRHRDAGLEVVSANTDDPTKARAMLRSLNMTVPLYLDTGAASDSYRVTTIPHLVIIDRHGMVRHVHRGFDGESTLDAQVSALLQEQR